MNLKFMEKTGKHILERFPRMKKIVKRAYQKFGVFWVRSVGLCEGNIVRVSPDDGYEYFCGYYDKSPWNISERYIIALRVRQAYKEVTPKESGMVCLIDIKQANKVIEIGKTRAWNVQQGCMAQWLGPDFEERIIYNDFRKGGYCSVIFNVKKMKEEKILPLPIYDISADGQVALSLDFNRLHRLRPGYGYSNLPDLTKGDLCPDYCCIWKINIASGYIEEMFKYTEFASFEPDVSMCGAEHKVNHLMISPNGKRFMVLHRWLKNGRKHTRLITVNMDKTDMYNLSDDVFVSHCFWKNNEEILSFLRKTKYGDHYYIMKDKTKEYKMMWGNLDIDGHCSYSKDSRYVVTDTYPNRNRIASVFLCTEQREKMFLIGKVFSSFKYDNECRCDLHPRWNWNSDKICIDSTHEGKRGIYTIGIEKYVHKNKESKYTVSVVIPTHNRKETLKRAIRSILNQTYPIKEIVIISDGSTDGTDDIVKPLQSKYNNILYYSYFPSKGANYARNCGIKIATSDYIAFLDDDDEWLPDKIKLQMDIIANNNKIGMVCTGKNRIFDGLGLDNEIIPNVPQNCKKEILLRNCVGSTSVVLVKKELLLQSGGFDEKLSALQDYDLWIRICQLTQVGTVNKACVNNYNQVGQEQISHNIDKYIKAESYIDEKYAVLLGKLTKKERKRRNSYLNMLISKKGMLNRNLGIAIKYGFKAFVCQPRKATFICFIAAFVPFKFTIAIQRKIGNKGIS